MEHNGLSHTILRLLLRWDSSSVYQRIIVVVLLFFVIFAAICYQLLFLATSDAENKNLTNYSSKQVVREEIVDRNGIIIATNIPSVSLYANPKKMIDVQEAAEKISTLFPDINAKQLKEKLSQPNKTFVWIKRDLTAKQQMEVNGLGIPGVYFEQEMKRIYPYGKLFSHIVGYVGRDNNGLAGAEKYFDKQMMAQTDKEPGPLRLTLDMRVQNIAREELAHTIKQFDALGGVCIIADPNNGEIIASVSLPDFDPYAPSAAKPEALFNQASLGIYEMGSVIKPITLAIAFDTSTVDLYDLYNLSSIRVANFTVRDYHKTTGWHSVAEVFLHSSNIGVSQMALEVGEKKFKTYLEKLGLFSQLNIELPERGLPLYPDIKKKWSDLSLTTMSYGYGISISPLHFIQAMIPIVNGGIMHPLTIKSSPDNLGQGRQVLHKNTSEKINKLLRTTITHGTGKKASVENYYVGGKTGTANKRKNGRYVNNSRMSSFVATFPAHKPEYLLYVMIDDPQGRKDTFGFATAGWTAAPTIAKIIERMVTLYGKAPYDPNDAEIIELENIIISANDQT